MTQMLKSLNKMDQDKQSVRNSAEFENNKEVKPKTMDFLFIKRLLYIKHEIDENPFDRTANYSVGQNEYYDDKSRTKTPKSLIVGRRKKVPMRIEGRLLSGCSSELDHTKARVKTTMHRQRKHEYSSMSPLKLFEKANQIQNTNNVSVDLK